MTQWQPIDSAPKDGTRVLLGRFVKKCQERKNGRMEVDRWHEPKRDKCGFTGWGCFNEQYWPATHWAPLPTPPDHA